MARPSKYTEELANLICERISNSSVGLHKICKEDGFPAYSTVFKWLSEADKTSFIDKYARAREAQAELLADEIISIADDDENDVTITEEGVSPKINYDNIQRARLRVDARKWKASKLYPKKYGDKIEVDQTNAGNITIKVIRE